MQLRFVLAAISAAIGLFFAWRVLGALRSGRISVALHLGPERHYSRASNAGSFWIAVSWYAAFGAAAFYVAISILRAWADVCRADATA